MGRKKLNLTEAKIEKMLLSGRGRGKGDGYQSWLKNGDFSSKGRSSRIKSTKFNRIHHTFSDLETDFLYTLLWDDSIVDIREQYSLLPVSETEEIANILGIRYPKPPKYRKDEEEKYVHVMTTDFLVTKIEDGVEFYIAYCVKLENDLLKSRALQKIAIEEAYWNKRNVKFKIITENSFSRKKAKNIKRIVNKVTLPLDEFITSEEFYTISSKLKESIIEFYDKNVMLNDICKQIDINFNLDSGQTLHSFFYLAGIKDIPILLDSRLIGSKMINEIIDIETLKIEYSRRSNQNELNA